MFETYVVLLRGINLGGKNKLPMKDLAGMLTELGCHDVTTYIQSGNAVVGMDAALAAALPGRLAERIQEQAGLRVPVVVRAREAFTAVVHDNPFLAAGADPQALHVMFLADEPSPEDVALLDPNRSPADAYLVRGREIYLHCPQGVADSRLTNAYFDARLKTVSTSRNWRTVLKLRDMAEDSHRGGVLG
ncbi:MAG: DUF1697 domain-containing protein [Candidatus Sericytochromatia bacterium]